MVRFLPQALPQAPNMRVDFSPLSQLGDQIGAMRRENEHKSTLAEIGKVAASGDYGLAAKAAFEQGQLGLGSQFAQADFRRQQALQPKSQKPTALMQNLQAAFDPNTDPRIREHILNSINKPTGTSVTVNNAGETAFAKERGKFQAQRFQNVQEAGDQADLTIGKLNQAEELLNNPDLYSGPGGELVQGAKSLAVAAGFDVQGQGEGALLKTITADLALADLQGFKGATSNKELDFVLRKAPGISNTREGNRLLVGMKKLEQQHLSAKRDLFVEHGGRPPRAAVAELNKSTNKAFRGFVRQMRKIKVDQPSPAAGTALDRQRARAKKYGFD